MTRVKNTGRRKQMICWQCITDCVAVLVTPSAMISLMSVDGVQDSAT